MNRFRLIALALTLVLVLATTVTSFAAGELSPGASVNYTHTNSKNTFYSGDYVGKCCETGKDAASSGTGTIEERISNDSTLAKFAYYYTYEKEKIEDTSKLPGAGDPNIIWAEMTAFAIGYIDMGPSAWRAAASSFLSDGGVAVREDFIKDMIEDCKNVTVPGGFEMYRVSTASSSTQDFMLWKYNPSGYVKVKKVSNNPEITG